MQRPMKRCAVLVLAGGLSLAGCSLDKSRAPDDQAVASEIQSKLFQDSVLKARDIRVATEKGVVTLAGTVNTELEKSAAVRLAREATGVKDVVDQLTVSGAETAGTEASLEEATRAAAKAPVEPARPARRRTKSATKPRAAEPSPASGTPAAPPVAVAETTPAPATRQAAPATREPEQITIPAGTVVTVRMVDGIDSSVHRAGEEFTATLEAPVVVDDRVIIRRGADARVKLVEAKSAGRITGRSELRVELVGLSVGTQTYSVESDVHEEVGASRGKRTAQTVGGGAAVGALIGAVAGKGKGAAIGAAVGAGAGTAVQAATRGQQVKIAPETKLDFTLRGPVTISM